MNLRVQATADAQWRPPSRWQAMDRWWRIRVLSVFRSLHDTVDVRLRRWRAQPLAGEVLAEVRSELWSMSRPDEFVLTAGKVHNLRRAARAFDGVMVPAGRRLSFWRQLGRATRWRGFVPGRELKAGCVVPVVGGGLCQLSNAIATCATRAGMQLLERHAHSMRPVGPGSEDMVDATVLWNYVDLRVRAAYDWQLEVRLDDRWLVVRIRAKASTSARVPVAAGDGEALRAHLPLSARSCVSCGESACFRHRGQAPSQPAEAWLLDEDRPEWRRERAVRGASVEIYQPWTLRRHASGSIGARHRLVAAGLAGAIWRRLYSRHSGRRQASIIRTQVWLARAMARRLRPGHRQVVIDQPLLAHLWQAGVLGGRRFTVLAAALPMAEIERRLDGAMGGQHDELARASLHDFRIDPALAEAELEALRAASEVLTPHADVARFLVRSGIRARRIPWSMPKTTQAVRDAVTRPPLVVFPASALARKGFHDLLAALRGCRVRLRVLGTLGALPADLDGIEIEQGDYADDWPTRASVIVLPAYIEHRPRALLMALAAGVPVIASTACGVDHMDGVTAVEAGDIDGLRVALEDVVGVSP